jgi:hypothetical protein
MAPTGGLNVPVAVVVSPHGFGHAARMAAVMDAMAQRRPSLEFHVLTTVPRWFFSDSLNLDFKLHRLVTDVGLVQRTALNEDLDATVRRLDRVYDPAAGALDRMAMRISRLRCRVVICDISPLGLAAAHRLGLPSVLVENFTWDWIYRGYGDVPDGLTAHADRMASLFDLADLRIQAEPCCQPVRHATAVAPVARSRRRTTAEVRRLLGVPHRAPMVLLTMGGLSWDYLSLQRLEGHPEAHFVVPGGGPSTSRNGRLLVLPFRSEFFHPDLVAASDLVVGKLGYSTVAETLQSGAAMAYIGRPGFRESPVLADYVRRATPAVEISQTAFDDGSWLEAIENLLGQPKPPARTTDGSSQAAELILDRFDREFRS